MEPHALKTYDEKVVGMHGYDDQEEDMKSTMLAIGPDFKNQQVEYFDSKSIYPLVCSLLELNKCHASPGSIDGAKAAVPGMTVTSSNLGAVNQPEQIGYKVGHYSD